MVMTEAPLRELEDLLVPEKAYLTADEDIEDMMLMMFYMEEAA